ncbi:penicillin acylase family protein [Leadbetterella sp. DM7]|uniref:penicillin acylase family protein n=1 Tax=Leadbetterella sp. DM7 TaxID=3235085 RepID=UPI00349E693C
MNRYLFCGICLMLTGLTAAAQHRVQVEGLKEEVEIYRDTWGINHIYAANEPDLFFAQGYSAAKDRLFQFELWRRQATGTVSEILGPSERKRDIGLRLFKYRGDMQKELSHYHPNSAAIIQAYVNGVNACIDEANRNPDTLPVEFKMLDIRPQKWTPEIVISRHQGLLGNIEDELKTGRAVAAAGARQVSDLLYFHPRQPDLRLDPSITQEMLSHDILELYKASHRPLTFGPEHSAYVENRREDKDGSNNWIVSGSRTASGFPHLANDPHRSVSLPALRYVVHLSAPGWNVIGGGEPVIPGVSIGHNEHGAWGLTIFETDFEDLYVYDLNPGKLSQYQYKGRWEEMQTIREEIKIKGQAPEKVDLRYTRHGPVVYIDTLNKKGYAVRCAWLEPGGAPYLASLRFNQAESWEEFREATRYSHVPAENMIWADRHGDTGWQVVGLAPVRKNFSGMVPVPGDGRFEWSGYLPMLERPNSHNPPEGFLATANENVTPPGYSHWDAVGYLWSDPFRGDRIREVLAAKDKMTLQDHQALQTDYFSLPARELVPLLSGLKFGDSLTENARKHLETWDYRLEPDAVEAGIYAMWERKLSQEATAALVPAELKGLVSLQLKKLIQWIKDPESPIQDKTAFLTVTFEKAIAELVKKLGDDPEKWQYGQATYKHIRLTHPLSDFLSSEEQEAMNLSPLPRGGNSYTPNATGGTDTQRHGATFRVIIDTGDWDKTLMTLSPGQSGDPASPFYSNLFKSWAQDTYFPAYFSKDKVEAHTYEKTVLTKKK